MRYINTIGQIVRNYFSATGGLVTFFAPWNEAFERIPEPIERRLLRDRIWLEQVGDYLLEDEITLVVCMMWQGKCFSDPQAAHRSSKGTDYRRNHKSNACRDGRQHAALVLRPWRMAQEQHQYVP